MFIFERAKIMKAKSAANTESFPIIQIVITFFLVIAAFALGNNLIKEDLPVVTSWWMWIMIIGIAYFPLTYSIFHRFTDGGYIIGKGLGIAISSWIVWAFSTFHLFRYSRVSCIVVVLVSAAISYTLYIVLCRKKGKKAFEGLNMTKISYMALFEAMFLLAFIALCYVRSFRVTITCDTEKYMDFGFLASALNSDYMPANDMWFAGKPINYYYFGIYVASFLSKISGTTAGYGYNLGLMTIMALGMMQVYSIAHELIKLAADEVGKRRNKPVSGMLKLFLSHSGAAFTSLTVFIAGNMQYVLYAYIIPWIQKTFMKVEPDSYWFPDATRFIQDTVKDTNGIEQTGDLIHEFPSYSFVLGDLHAHVTDIMFVLVIISVLFAFLLNRKEKMEEARNKAVYVTFGKWKDYISYAVTPEIIVVSFLIGIFRVTNYWDFPIYFIVSGAVILFSNAIITGFKLKALILTAVHAAEVIVISTIVALPFNINYDSMVSSIGICGTHSSLYELAVLWLLPVSVCIGLFAVAISIYNKKVAAVEASTPKKGSMIKRSEPADPMIRGKESHKINHLFSFIYKLELSDLFILTIAACAMGLVLMPELIYVVDIYGGAYARTNTMFKLTYQAYIMFGIVMGYAITRFIGFAETKAQRILSIIACMFVIWTFGYFSLSLKSFVGEVDKPDSKYRTLDSYNVIQENESAGVKETIDWVRNNVEPGAVILQMNSTSYKNFATISAFTGNPTVVGWSYHEWLWRNGGKPLVYPKIITERDNDVITLYTTEDVNEARRLIEEYDIDYIYVGLTETMNGKSVTDEYRDDTTFYKGSYYDRINTNHALIKSLGTVVYDGHTEASGYQTYIVKVDRQ